MRIIDLVVTEYIIIAAAVGFLLSSMFGDRGTDRGELMFPEDKRK